MNPRNGCSIVRDWHHYRYFWHIFCRKKSVTNLANPKLSKKAEKAFGDIKMSPKLWILYLWKIYRTGFEISILIHPFTDQGQNSHLSIQGEGISAKNRQLFTKLILLKWFRCDKLTLLVLHYYIFGFKWMISVNSSSAMCRLNLWINTF